MRESCAEAQLRADHASCRPLACWWVPTTTQACSPQRHYAYFGLAPARAEIAILPEAGHINEVRLFGRHGYRRPHPLAAHPIELRLAVGSTDR